ncbi:threonylcarbamoyl-AMP synthase [Candidatus Peregrinibacteria bacterium]|nr:threonylcarbamoyl-AMP synthase [Candidatus Peregrinibacteria bacterium]
MKKSLQKALNKLRTGGVIAHATETCYGFACDAFSKRALVSLYKIKKMSLQKPVSIMVHSLTMAKKYGVFSKKALIFAKKYWPGPLTIIVKRKNTLPKFFNPGIKTIGIRVPAHALSIKLIKAFGRPLTTTSANISGQPPPYSVSAIQKQFRSRKLKPDFILDSGRLKKNPPSTIIDISQKTPKIIRHGSFHLSEKIFGC